MRLAGCTRCTYMNTGPVAECTLPPVNDQDASPQLVTVAMAVVLLPTVRLPNPRVSWSVQIHRGVRAAKIVGARP